MEGVIYTTGEFDRKAGVSVGTIRYYDKQGILILSHVREPGYMPHTDGDFGERRPSPISRLGFFTQKKSGDRSFPPPPISGSVRRTIRCRSRIPR